MNPNEKRALILLRKAGGGWTDPKQITSGLNLTTDDPLRINYRVWNQLTAAGFTDRRINSEQVRGEPRVSWSEYRITLKGRLKAVELEKLDA